MKTICLDTNAIIDLCYRYYPEVIFPTIWQNLQASHSAKHVQFVLSEHVDGEINHQINRLDYDKKMFDKFITQFQIKTIPESAYQYELLNLKSNLVKALSNPNKLLNKLNQLDNDFSNICVASLNNGCVLTSEQGFGRDVTLASQTRDIKIPDTCRWQDVECHNWVSLFHYLGIML